MAAVEMTSIHFYRPSPVTSPCLSLKPSTWDSADERRDATLQRDRGDKPFKTNYEIEPQLQSKLAGETRAGDGGNF